MHDITELEGSGVPGAFVASSEFVEAARAQSESLGFDPARVFVSHPIQDRTDEEMRAIAESAVDEIVRAITAPPPG